MKTTEEMARELQKSGDNRSINAIKKFNKLCEDIGSESIKFEIGEDE